MAHIGSLNANFRIIYIIFIMTYMSNFELSFTVAEVGNVDINFKSYFELTSTMAKVDNLHTNLECYFKLSFIVAEVVILM